MDMLKLEEVLISWNPWWQGAGDSTIPRKRYAARVTSWLGRGKAISLHGIRKCGKTTIAKQVLYASISKGKKPEECCYVNFEDERFYGELSSPNIIEEVYMAFLALKNPQGRALLILDEIQGVGGWEKWARRVIEQKLDLDLILTGSSADLLSGDLSTAMTGRSIPIEVRPLSFREFLDFKKVPCPRILDAKEAFLKLNKPQFQNLLRQYINYGGMPEIVLEESAEKKRELARAYFSDILFRDIVKRYGVKETKVLEEIALFCLANSSGYISFNKLANKLKASINTVKQYVDYLEKAYLIRIAPQFSYSVKSQQHADRLRKAYAIDNGLRNLISFKFSQDLGKMAENTAFVNTLGGEKRHFSWKGIGEVDIVTYDGKALEALNVCFGEIKEREYAGLREFGKKYPKAKLTLITMDEFGEKEGIKLIPLWLFLLSA